MSPEQAVKETAILEGLFPGGQCEANGFSCLHPASSSLRPDSPCYLPPRFSFTVRLSLLSASGGFPWYSFTVHSLAVKDFTPSGQRSQTSAPSAPSLPALCGYPFSPPLADSPCKISLCIHPRLITLRFPGTFPSPQRPLLLLFVSAVRNFLTYFPLTALRSAASSAATRPSPGLPHRGNRCGCSGNRIPIRHP